MIDLDNLLRLIEPSDYCGQDVIDLIAELRAAREVVEAAMVGAFHHNSCPWWEGGFHCRCSNQLVKDALKTYDEARRGD
jgi:hypothetical protein